MSSPASAARTAGRRHKITRHSIYLLIGLQILLALVVTIGTLSYLREIRSQALETRLNQMVTSLRSVEEHLTQTLYLVGLTLANLPDLSGYQPGESPQQVQANLEKIQRQMPVLRSLSFADSEGHVLASSVAANVGKTFNPDLLLPVVPVERTHLLRIGAPWQGRDLFDGKPVRAEAPSHTPGGTFFPVMLSLPGKTTIIALASINSDYFLNRIFNNLEMSQLHLSIFDYNANLLFSNDPMMGTEALNLGDEHLEEIKRLEIGQERAGEAHGQAALTAFRTSRIYPLFVVGHTLHASILATLEATTTTIITRVATALLITLLLTGFLTKRLANAYDKEARLREAQQLAASVFKYSNNGIVITDAETRILSVNPAFERISGYRSPEVIGQTPRLLASGKHPKAFYTQMWSSLGEKGEWQGEIINRRKDGNTLTEWLTIVRMQSEHQELVGYFAIFNDLSELRNSEQIIRQLYTAVEQSPSSIIITSLDPVIEYVTPSFSRVTGYSPEEVIGNNPRVLQSKLTPTATYQAMWDTLATGECWEGEFINRRKDGTIYHEQALISPIKSATGEIIRYLAIKNDITERKALEQRLLDAKEAAESSSRAKSEFLANMSHEIRTPLNAIIGMTQLVLDSPLSDEQRSQLTKAQHAAVGLLGILNDILDFSKIEAGKLAFEAIPFNLVSVLNHLRDIFSLTTSEKGIALTLHHDAEVPLSLVGDPLRLTQVLTNLLNNALKFTAHGKIDLRISLADATANTQQSSLQFSVSDTGIGISDSQLAQLFQPFHQGDNTITRTYGGTGLGLTISQRLVTAMGGKITVKSQVGSGSQFNFTLPFPLAEETTTMLLPLTQTPLSHESRPQKAALKGISLLLVEDNPLNQQLFYTLLTRAGVQ
ncbi:MAG: PAS domain S-box protein, partial [Gammaproteobacteria bacterium]|nr:PAS domain S-box protein [Gammaproteobacteria bacterium]